jgi:nucleoside triphosphate pyrophosphatase
MEPIVLASASPQRRAILTQLGVPFVIRPSGVDEIEEGPPEEVALENARRKAEAVRGDHVLGVDTVVALDGRLYGKPRDEADARATLDALGGRTHTVHSGLVLTNVGQAVEATRVTFRPLDDALTDWYLATGEWRDRAGGYAIQDRGAALVRRIDGDYGNVVGLPIPALLDLLKTLGFPGKSA